MQRRSESDDIPIRPRYGIPVEIATVNNKEINMTEISGTQIKSRKTPTVPEEVASSYTEIPFLAQYPGEVSEDALKYEKSIVSESSQHDKERTDSLDDEYDMDEDNSNSSSGAASKTPKRPISLHYESSFPYELDGATSNSGEMRHFVASNLEEKLRSASPLNKTDLGLASHSSTPSTSNPLTRRFLQTQMPQIDANVLSDIEIEALQLAGSVDNLTENLCNLLHSISSITADNVELHKNAINKLTDSMDANIKCMYTIMAKTEEISKAMKPTEQLGLRIREIKRLVDMLDSTM